MKILLWDIETSPLVMRVWNLWDPPAKYENIIEETTLLSVAWKWLGSKEVDCLAIKPTRPRDDKALVKATHRILSQADVLVGHNGDRFDLRRFNTRAIKHGLPPLPPIPTIDTLKVAKRYFGFNSNRLDYLGEFLGVGKKLKTEPQLWTRVLEGDREAILLMERYNKQDVTLLEKVYLALRPFIRNHPNANLHGGNGTRCPNCESESLVKQGFKYQRTTKRQQYRCRECGAWSCGEYVSRSKVA